MGIHEALLSGASIGLTVAAPIGPMAVIVIRRTISSGFLVGIVSGAGASTVHLVYATFALCGVDRMAKQSSDSRSVMTIVTALTLLFFAVRMLRPRSASRKVVAAGKSLFGHYTSALAFNSVNPMGFALILGAVTAVSGLAANGSGSISALAGGVFIGSFLWWIGLVGITAAIGLRFSPRAVRLIDVVAGLFLLGLAVSTVSRIL